MTRPPKPERPSSTSAGRRYGIVWGTPPAWLRGTRARPTSAALLPAPALTTDELHAIDLTVDLWNTLVGIVGRDESRAGDLAELAGHIHVIQRSVMAQAAARAYPDKFRLLGEVIPR